MVINMEQTFQQIKEQITNWVYGKKTQLEYVKTDIDLDTQDSLRVFFESDDLLAELLVEQGLFTPYRFVKLEILNIASNKPVLIYAWYDSQNDDINTIINNLQIGLDYIKKR